MASPARRAYLITGAAGLLGRECVRQLALRRPEIRIRALTRRPPAEMERRANVEWLRGSLEDSESLAAALAGADTVLHLAAATHAHDRAVYFKVNAEGTRNLLLAALCVSGISQFVYVSTRAVGRACGAYGESKMAAEQYVEASGLPYVILRPAEVAARGAKEGLMSLVNLVKKIPLVPYPAGPIYLSPVLLEDAAAAILAAADRDGLRSKIYTIAGLKTYSLRALLEEVALRLKLKRIFLPVPLGALKFFSAAAALAGARLIAADQFARLTCVKDTDIGPARQDLGFDPKDFFESPDWMASV